MSRFHPIPNPYKEALTIDFPLGEYRLIYKVVENAILIIQVRKRNDDEVYQELSLHGSA